MKKIAIMLLIFLLSNSLAKVITNQLSWGTTTRNNAVYGAYCDMKFDTDNGNYSYECKGVELSEFTVKDYNGFVVGNSIIGIYRNGYSGYDGSGTIKSINGIPSRLSGRGRVDSTTHFMGCSYGYIQPSYNTKYCIEKPTNSFYGAYDGADFGYRCEAGYEDIDGQCVKQCKPNQFFSHSSSECVTIPKHAYKTSYNDYECNVGYEYQARSDQRCVKSCTENEIMDSTSYTCKSKYTKEFIKYCSVPVSNEIICKNGYDWYYIDIANDIRTAKKLPKGVLSFNVDGYIQNCEASYKYIDGECVPIVTETFTDHCFMENQDMTYAAVTCDEKWDHCKQNDLYHAVKLPANAITIAEDCITIVGCEYEYKLDSNKNECIQSN